MKKYIYPLILTILCAFFSCEDYLGNKPKEQVVPTTTKDYEMLLNFYSVLQTSGVYSCFLTDDVFLPDNDTVQSLSIQTVSETILRFYKLEEELFTLGDKDRDWENCYSPIYTFNVIVKEVLNSTEGSENEKNNIYAEALLARAFQYHQLIVLYAKAFNAETASQVPGVPLITEPDINQKNLTRASVQQVLDLVETDLKTAIPLLPEKPTLNAFRGSKPAAEALLARFYMYQGKFGEALELVESAIKTKPDILNLNSYAVVDSTTSSGRTNVPQYENNPEALYIRTTSFGNTMSGRAYVNLDLLKLFDEENDRRFKLFITKNFRGKKLDHFIWAQAMDANIGITVPEVYLIAAECHARTGNLDLALDRLEVLRKNRYENYVPIDRHNLTKNDVIKLVLDERRRELMMIPPIRLADIKRLGFDPDFSQAVTRTINGVTTSYPPTSNRFVYPIPHIVMQFNPGMEQNSRKD